MTSFYSLQQASEFESKFVDFLCGPYQLAAILAQGVCGRVCGMPRAQEFIWFSVGFGPRPEQVQFDVYDNHN